MMTWLPNRCNDSARPRPIPVPPPVTRMVLPVNCMSLSLSVASYTCILDEDLVNVSVP